MKDEAQKGEVIITQNRHLLNRHLFGKRVNVALLVGGLCVICPLLPDCGAAEREDSQPLLTLARTPPEQYLAQLGEFLRVHTNRIDVVEATKAGWEAGLMALIVNSRLDHATEYQEGDKYGPRSGQSGFYYYGFVSVSNSAVEASVFERLWKGGRLGLRDLETSGTSEFGPLPAYAGRYIISVLCRQRAKIGAAIPEPLLLALLQADPPEQVRTIAGYALAGRETPTARAVLFQVLANPSEPSGLREGVLLGIAAYTPGYGWEILRDTLSNWGHDTNLIASGYTALAQLSDPAAHDQLRSIAADTNAAQILRECAVSRLGLTRTEKLDTFKSILLDPSASADLKILAIAQISKFPGKEVRKAIEESDLKGFDPRVQRSLIELPAHVPRAGPEEVRFIRALSERTDLSPELRNAAREAADKLSKRIKATP